MIFCDFLYNTTIQKYNDLQNVRLRQNDITIYRILPKFWKFSIVASKLLISLKNYIFFWKPQYNNEYHICVDFVRLNLIEVNCRWCPECLGADCNWGKRSNVRFNWIYLKRLFSKLATISESNQWLLIWIKGVIGDLHYVIIS